MNEKKKYILYALVLGMMGILSYACAGAGGLNPGRLQVYMDLHGVESSLGWARYNLRSESDIDRAAKRTWQGMPSLEKIESGSIGTWQWTIYALPSIAPLVRTLSKERTVVIGSGAAAHQLRVPSLSEAMKEFHRFYHALLGKDLYPLHVALALYPEGVHVRIEKNLHSNAAIPLYFAFNIPDKVATDGGAAYSWLVDTLGLVGHEYWHAYNRESGKPRFINMATEEVTAYTLERCLETALANGQGTFHLIDQGGAPINIKTLPQKRSKSLASSESSLASELSNEARILSLYNMAWVLQTNVIKKQDTGLQEKLYGLCYAMVHEPVDMTKGFYPRDKVKPLPFGS